MDDINLFDLREDLNRQGVLLCLNGPFSHGVIEEFGKAVRTYLENEDVKKSSLSDVFSVYVEQTQNVHNYFAQADIPDSERQRICASVVMIGKVGEKHVVGSGNFVKERDTQPLVARLEQLRGLDKAGLKALFKEQIRKELPAVSVGAGLGLIDMARKASEPLRYSMRKIDEQFSFFSLRVLL